MNDMDRVGALAAQPLAWVVGGILLALLGVPLALGLKVGLLFWICAAAGGFLFTVGTIALGVSLGLRHERGTPEGEV